MSRPACVSRKLILTLSTLLLVALVGPSCCGPNTLGIRSEVVRFRPPVEESFVFIAHKFQEKLCKEDICITAEPQNIAGSGFSVATSGIYTWIVTAAHLCAPRESLASSEILAVGLGGVGYRAVVQYVEKAIDTCFLTIEGADIPPVKVASRNVTRGERVIALGAPLGIFDSEMILKFEGFYAGKTTEVVKPGEPAKKFPVLDGFTIPARPGSSGGPIFNVEGELVGMTIMAKPYFESFALSPPQTIIRHLIKAVQDKASNLTLIQRQAH